MENYSNLTYVYQIDRHTLKMHKYVYTSIESLLEAYKNSISSKYNTVLDGDKIISTLPGNDYRFILETKIKKIPVDVTILRR